MGVCHGWKLLDISTEFVCRQMSAYTQYYNNQHSIVKHMHFYHVYLNNLDKYKIIPVCWNKNPARSDFKIQHNILILLSSKQINSIAIPTYLTTFLEISTKSENNLIYNTTTWTLQWKTERRNKADALGSNSSVKYMCSVPLLFYAINVFKVTKHSAKAKEHCGDLLQ